MGFAPRIWTCRRGITARVYSSRPIAPSEMEQLPALVEQLIVAIVIEKWLGTFDLD